MKVLVRGCDTVLGTHWGGHRARADVDGPDIVLAQFHASGAGEHAHAALGYAVGDIAGHRPFLVHEEMLRTIPPLP